MQLPTTNKTGFPSEVLADFADFRVRAPLPEAYFVHRLITSQRRFGVSKKDKDLEQCSLIARRIDPEWLQTIIGSLKLSKKTQKALRASCTAIDFSRQIVGFP